MKFQPRPRFEALAYAAGAFLVQNGFFGVLEPLEAPGGPWTALEAPARLELRETPTCMDEAE